MPSYYTSKTTGDETVYQYDYRQIHVANDVVKELKELAKREGRTIQWLATFALRQYLDKQRKKGGRK